MITVSLNVGPLMAKLQKFGHEIRKPMQEIVKESAKLFVSATSKTGGMIQVTPPFGTVGGKRTSASAARKLGEGKVRRDIRRVYGIPSDMRAIIHAKSPQAAAAFWAMCRANEWDKASALAVRMTGIMLQEFDNGAAHRRRRKNGVVNDTRPAMFLRDPIGREGPLDRYIKQKQANVGILASGFNETVSRLGSKGVPDWVLRHGSTFSGITVQETPTSFYVIISDKVPFGSSDTERRMRYVLEYREKAFDYDVKRKIREVINLAGFATTLT